MAFYNVVLCFTMLNGQIPFVCFLFNSVLVRTIFSEVPLINNGCAAHVRAPLIFYSAAAPNTLSSPSWVLKAFGRQLQCGPGASPCLPPPPSSNEGPASTRVPLGGHIATGWAGHPLPLPAVTPSTPQHPAGVDSWGLSLGLCDKTQWAALYPVWCLLCRCGPWGFGPGWEMFCPADCGSSHRLALCGRERGASHGQLSHVLTQTTTWRPSGQFWVPTPSLQPMRLLTPRIGILSLRFIMRIINHWSSRWLNGTRPSVT